MASTNDRPQVPAKHETASIKPPLVENKNRREVVKKIALGTAALTGCSLLPEKWTTPLVEFGALPDHATTSGLVEELVKAIEETEADSGAAVMHVIGDKCMGCGVCVSHCDTGSIRMISAEGGSDAAACEPGASEEQARREGAVHNGENRSFHGFESLWGAGCSVPPAGASGLSAVAPAKAEAPRAPPLTYSHDHASLP